MPDLVPRSIADGQIDPVEWELRIGREDGDDVYAPCEKAIPAMLIPRSHGDILPQTCQDCIGQDCSVILTSGAL